MTPRWIFIFFQFITFSLMGCSGLSQDVSQEIKQDRLEARQKMEQAEKSYEEREYQGLTSKESENWNSTDWSLWMNSRGGGGD